MRFFTLILCLFIGLAQLQAQVNIKKFQDIKPVGDYPNVKVMTLHSDQNSSVFLIFVKKEVKKHYHQYHTEVITVLEGKGEMFLDGEILDIKAGDCIVIPPNTEHAVITRSSKPLKVISVQSPEFFNNDRVVVEEPKKEKKEDKKEK